MDARGRAMSRTRRERECRRLSTSWEITRRSLLTPGFSLIGRGGCTRSCAGTRRTSSMTADWRRSKAKAWTARRSSVQARCAGRACGSWRFRTRGTPTPRPRRPAGSLAWCATCLVPGGVTRRGWSCRSARRTFSSLLPTTRRSGHPRGAFCGRVPDVHSGGHSRQIPGARGAGGYLLDGHLVG